MYKGINFEKAKEEPKRAGKKEVAAEEKGEVKKISRHDVLQDEKRPSKPISIQKNIGRVHRKPESV